MQEKAMNLEPEYLIYDEFLDGPIVAHCMSLVDQPFGFNYGDMPFYNGLALAIVYSDLVLVQQRVISETNQPTGPLFTTEDGMSYKATGQAISPFKLIDAVVDGRLYMNSYIDGFKMGRDYFNELYKPNSAVIYGTEIKQYTATLHDLYKHKNFGWQWQAKKQNGFLTHKVFRQYGYYAGLCFSIDLLVDKYPHLSQEITICATKTLIELTHVQIAMLYHFTGEPLTLNNANDIAQRYGQTSGEKLVNVYGQLEHRAARTARGRYTIKNYEKVIPLLTTSTAKMQAEGELKEAKLKSNK